MTQQETSPSEDTTRRAGGDHTVAADNTVRLHITQCGRCGSRWFPARPVCGACGSTDITPDLVGPTGTVYSATIVRLDTPGGYRGPYALAYLDVDGVRLLAHLHADTDDPATPGLGVRLESRAVALDAGTTVYSYVAVPITNSLPGEA